ncbi:MAG TPA: ATP F0F1 synthase subunit B' [Rickettsia endosymbiont of Pyrocoelia pectoralis]|nr:ATP F0F1 synthase subunit B' [Rickettsia endosymbiont of Pyrocoelia pectoralis]
MPQFDIGTYYSQIFWLVVTFSLLYVFVSKLIVPKAEKIINNRKINIEENVESADNLALETEKLSKYYNQEVAKITTDIDKLKKEKIDSLESEFLIKKNSLEQDLRGSINQNIESINLAAQKFKANKSEAIIKLAASIIEKITGTKADINLLKNIKIQ